MIVQPSFEAHRRQRMLAEVRTSEDDGAFVASALAWLGTPFSLSPNCRNPANLPKSRWASPSLDFLGLVAMFHATFGKSGRRMRNKITKLLIIVVARRTA